MSKITPIYKNDYPKIVIPLVQAAVSSIDVLTYDWQWYPNNPEHDIQQLNMSLVMAQPNGVTVRAIVNNKVLVNLLKGHGIKAKALEGTGILHAKFMLIDNTYLILGSHNLTYRAMAENIETSLLVQDPEILAYFVQLFNNLYAT